jgi:type IV pilus assembly protein PilY1
MTTFTLGLGVDGTLANPGDYAGLVSGTKNWPDPTASTSEKQRIDDLWHAAVNGHGINQNGGNLSAKNPDAVVTELSKALQSINAVVGSSSAAATSTLQPVAGDNSVYIAQFKTVAWTGDLVARTINPVNGIVSTTNTWSAQSLLDSQSTRNIYTFSNGSTNNVRTFTAANLTSEIAAGYFNSDSSNPGGALTQYAGWSALQKAAATSTAMINYIRGVRTNELAGDGTLLTDLFRTREHVLGDIVYAAPVYVRKPPFAYNDSGYAAFITAQSARAATVYVGANDGMLHAFDGTTGQSGSGSERWAYVPSMVIKNLYKLSASDYSTNHRFYVDGPIGVGDAYNTATSSWSTILVGGLGGGGKGYYALDVTNPASPKALWEFGTTADYTGDTSFDADLGFSYGNPIITKRPDGKWVVVFTSGYNNSSGDKKGRLYVVDAFTGAVLEEIITTTTNDEDLSGMGRIANFVDDSRKDNTTHYVYGGDLSGALWRFDIDSASVVKLGSTSATAGNKPITTQPKLAEVKVGTTRYKVVYFGTGRYLGPNDLTAPSASVAQTIFAVKDTGADLGVLTASGATLVGQTLNSAVTPRTSTSTAVDWSASNGWYMSVPVGERFNIDADLQFGTLVIAANRPSADYCQPTGSSILYQLNYKNGNVLTTGELSAQMVGGTVIVLGSDQSHGGGGTPNYLCVLADGSTCTLPLNRPPSLGTGAIRISWREIE